MSGGGGVSGEASLAGPSARSEFMSGDGARADWQRIHACVEALAASRAIVESLNGIQYEFWNARDNINRARLHEAELGRCRWEAACKELLPRDSPRLTELLTSDFEDSRFCKALFEMENSELEMQLKGARRHVELSETDVGYEDIVRDLRAQLTNLKQAYETLCTNKDKEAIEATQKLREKIEELQARKNDIARLRAKVVDAKNKLRAMEKDKTALLKRQEVERAQATAETHKLQKNVEDLQVAAIDKDDEIRRLRAEALAAKNEIQKLKDGQLKYHKRKSASLSNESSQKRRMDISEMHLEQSTVSAREHCADLDRGLVCNLRDRGIEMARLRGVIDQAAETMQQLGLVPAERNPDFVHDRLEDTTRFFDKALECQRKAEEDLARQGATLKKTQDARNTAMVKADTLSMNLGKLRAEHMRQVDALEKAHQWIAATMPGLGLAPKPLQDRDIGDLISFFANLTGQLEALPDLLAARADREGRQIVEATAGLLLPRVHQLAPGFPFNALLDEFATPEEEKAATVAVRSVIEEVKKAARRH